MPQFKSRVVTLKTAMKHQPGSEAFKGTSATVATVATSATVATPAKLPTPTRATWRDFLSSERGEKTYATTKQHIKTTNPSKRSVMETSSTEFLRVEIVDQ